MIDIIGRFLLSISLKDSTNVSRKRDVIRDVNRKDKKKYCFMVLSMSVSIF